MPDSRHGGDTPMDRWRAVAEAELRDRRLADLVTEMAQVKHPFRAGIKAQKGVEF